MHTRTSGRGTTLIAMECDHSSLPLHADNAGSDGISAIRKKGSIFRSVSFHPMRDSLFLSRGHGLSVYRYKYSQKELFRQVLFPEVCSAFFFSAFTFRFGLHDGNNSSPAAVLHPLFPVIYFSGSYNNWKKEEFFRQYSQNWYSSIPL